LARAAIATLLPLDRWAYHVGLNPRHFNQVTTQFDRSPHCQQVWVQYPWQAADRIGREEVANAISQAETALIALIGFFPLPVWMEAEPQRTTPPNDRSKVYLDLGNARGLFQSVRTAFGRFIVGGMPAHEDLGTASKADGTMQWLDLDGDGYFETARLTLVCPAALTDVNEVHCHFPDQEGDEWEIRPLRTVTIEAGNLIIDIDRHLLVDPDRWEALDPQEVDGDDDTHFVNEVGVSRMYNDPSQQCQLLWERVPGACGCGSTDCSACAWAAQWACLQARDPEMGIVTYQPGVWDEDTRTYTAAMLAVPRAPERVRLWYRSGFMGGGRRPYCDMHPELERIITHYSLTLLDRDLCSCSGVEDMVKRLRDDRALTSETGSYKLGARHLACPWGTTTGAIGAYERALNWALQRGVDY